MMTPQTTLALEHFLMDARRGPVMTWKAFATRKARPADALCHTPLQGPLMSHRSHALHTKFVDSVPQTLSRLQVSRAVARTPALECWYVPQCKIHWKLPCK
jgi:hypothetical protein